MATACIQLHVGTAADVDVARSLETTLLLRLTLASFFVTLRRVSDSASAIAPPESILTLS